jgi:hypothetical protein
MTSRREFLKAGLVAAALPVVADAAIPLGAARPVLTPLYKVLYDTRFPASVEFARRASARGLIVHAMRGDMTKFWYDDLYHRWQQGPAAIAGLTAHGPLFCLERLAWDKRMRVVYRGEHSPAARGCVAHRFEGPAEWLPGAARATADTIDWADALADVVASCPVGRPSGASVAAVTQSARVLPAEALFSWVIAPWPRA